MNKLYVIGIGPGEYEQMTLKAIHAMEKSEVIIGYTVYVDLVKEHFPGKEFLTTPMKKEVDRCVMAFEEAKKGKVVSMICSGDAGVYGMSGLMYEVGVNYPEVELEIIPGVTAALGGSARVHTLYGDVECQIKEGTQSGSKIRLKNKGIVSMRNAQFHGDQYVTVEVDVPRHLNAMAKQKLREYAGAERASA